MNIVKLNWMRKLATSKNYVVITDKEAVINVKGLSGDKFVDVLRAATHQQQLLSFREKLDEVITKYEKAISKQLAPTPARRTRKPGKKIEVKEG